MGKRELKRVAIVFYLDCDMAPGAMSPSYQAAQAMKGSPGFVSSLTMITDATAERLPPAALRRAWQRWEVTQDCVPRRYTIEFHGVRFHCNLGTWFPRQTEPIADHLWIGKYKPLGKTLADVLDLAAEQIGHDGRNGQQLKLEPDPLAELLAGRKGVPCPAGCYLAYSEAWHGEPCDPDTFQPKPTNRWRWQGGKIKDKRDT